MESVGVQKTGCSVCGQTKRPEEDNEQQIAFQNNNNLPTGNGWLWLLLVIVLLVILYFVFRNKKLGKMSRRK